MNDGRSSSLSTGQRIDEIVGRFEAAWETGQQPRIEDYLRDFSADDQAILFRELLRSEVVYRRKFTQGVDFQDYRDRFPQWVDVVDSILAHGDTALPGPSAVGPPSALFPTQPDYPNQLGRYRITSILGQGSFGIAFRGYDDQLRRDVAIKVPRRECLSYPNAIDEYVKEARVVAKLDHPHIVPVYDSGRTDDGLFFVVSRYIEGSDLKAKLAAERFSFSESAALVAAIADALHYAHRQALVHRDVKPANILLDRAGKPYLADFGLVLKEEDFGKGAGLAGTPAYMSPEQARGEGHRVNGQSDIFSLGVVFYEMLTGRRPFQADTREQLLDAIEHVEPKPPRQIDDAIPKELERICLKALAKRAADRYTTALDFAEDLRSADASIRRTLDPTRAKPRPGPVKIVPKGLRSFDAGDRDFFLELLPGPRDRDGLPVGLRFWKTRLEERDADRTFAVGLLYGPSGCGKTSFVKAGLMPLLAPHVRHIYIEATAEDTEMRLLRRLRKECPALDPALGLVESLATLRSGVGCGQNEKVVLVLDQFEQWLHAHRSETNAVLIHALRQCDGGRVQTVLMVRDDFWLAVSRFMTALEVDIRQRNNTALVDLFDGMHARKVLAEFGKAFGRLPENLGTLTRDQEAFLDQVIRGLSKDGKVVPVQLALFADMVKGKPWGLDTLHAMGGIAGVGETFLQETFNSSGANPRHRLHQHAARTVLQALLPEPGADIRGHMRSQADLLAACGMRDRPREFVELLRILDSELRLITPTDPEGADDSRLRLSDTSAGPQEERYYQLTHDYLIPSLRDWLTRQQRQTQRGRAAFEMGQRSAVWESAPDSRYLPTFWEWVKFRLLTRKRDWTPRQQRMMKRAARYFAVRGGILVLAVALVIVGGWWMYQRQHARYLVEQLLSTKTDEIPEKVEKLGPYHDWADPLLREQEDRPDLAPDKRLRINLALLPTDDGRTDEVCNHLMSAKGPEEVKAIREVLHKYRREAMANYFWRAVENDKDKPKQLRAAAALAETEADDARWERVGSGVVRSLAAENAAQMGDWLKLFAKVQPQLISHLDEADAKTFPALLSMMRGNREAAVSQLQKHLRPALAADAKPEERLASVWRQAHAAVALLGLGETEAVWPLFHQGADPTCRTYLIHRCAAWGVDPSILAKRLLSDEETDPSIRQGLLLALCEYKPDQQKEAATEALKKRVAQDYEGPDPGVHAAAEWLLRQWGPLPATATRERPRSGSVKSLGWWVNGQQQTFVVVPTPNEFEIGSPPHEAGRRADEPLHRVTINYSFAMAAKLITYAEFKKCRDDAGFKSLRRNFEPSDAFPLDDNAPINCVLWYDAAAYCNWLSYKEHLPPEQWCYEPNAKGEYAEGMRLKPNYRTLSGYRLPHPEEWEYACRAGTTTAWSHGSDPDMLRYYAWYNKYSEEKSHPVGSLKPNGWGLFDMHGNSLQWCQEIVRAKEDRETAPITNNDQGVNCGGSWRKSGSDCRSAYRNQAAPNTRDRDIGFRVCFRLPD